MKCTARAKVRLASPALQVDVPKKYFFGPSSGRKMLNLGLLRTPRKPLSTSAYQETDRRRRRRSPARSQAGRHGPLQLQGGPLPPPGLKEGSKRLIVRLAFAEKHFACPLQ